MPEVATIPNQFSELTEYEYHHLVNHCLEGELLDDLFELLTLEENEQNAWYTLQVVLDRVAAYTSDISNALEATAHEAGSADHDQTIVRQCYYALILASLNSLSNNYPPNYLAALVRNGIWTIGHALTYAKQMPDVTRRNAAFHALTAIVDQSVTADECLSAISVLGYSDEYWTMVCTLYPQLSSPRQYEVREQAIHEIKKNQDYALRRTGVLVQVAPLLLDSLDYYLMAEDCLLSPQAYAELIVRLFPVLPVAHREKVLPVVINYLEQLIAKISEVTLKMIIDIAPVHDLNVINICVQQMELGIPKAHALAYLAQRMPEPQRSIYVNDALRLATEQADINQRVQILTVVAPLLSAEKQVSVLRDTLVLIGSLEYPTSQAAQAGEISAREPGNWYNPGPQRSELLIAIAPVLPTTLLKDVRVQLDGVGNWQARIGQFWRGLPERFGNLADQLKSEDVKASFRIGSKEEHDALHAQLATYLVRANDLNGVLRFARSTKSPCDRARAFLAVLPHLDASHGEALVREMFKAIQVGLERTWWNEPNVEALVREMFKAIQEGRTNIDRDALDLIASVLPRDLLQEAIRQVDAIHDEPSIAQAMATILACSEGVSQQELKQVLSYVDLLKSDAQKDNVLGILAPIIAELSGPKTALQRIQSLHTSPKLRGLQSMSPYVREHPTLAQKSVNQAINEIKYAIKNDIYASSGAIQSLQLIAQFVDIIPEETRIKASSQALKLVYCLVYLRRSLSPSEHLEKVILDAVDLIFNALKTAQIFTMTEIFTRIGEDIRLQTAILSKLFTRLCQDQIPETLIVETLNKIDKPWPKVTIWSEICISCVPETQARVTEYLVESSMKIEDVSLRIYLLATLAPLLDSSRQQQILKDIMPIYNKSPRDALASEGLAVSLLKVGRKEDSLICLHNISNPKDKAVTIRKMASLADKDMLHMMALEAVQKSPELKGRAEIFVSLLPYLSETDIATQTKEISSAINQLSDPQKQFDILYVLIPKLPDVRLGVVCQFWGHIFKWLSTHERAQLLDKLTKLLPSMRQQGGSVALQGIGVILQQVSRWWP